MKMNVYVVKEITTDDYVGTMLNVDIELFNTMEEAKEYVDYEIDQVRDMEDVEAGDDYYVSSDDYHYLNDDSTNGERVTYEIVTKRVEVA